MIDDLNILSKFQEYSPEVLKILRDSLEKVLVTQHEKEALITEVTKFDVLIANK